MLILLASICAVVIIIGLVLTIARHYYRNNKFKDIDSKWYKLGHSAYMNDTNQIICIVGCVALGIVLFAMLIVGGEASSAMVIDDKIAMYEEENAAINEEINILIANYQEHEMDVFDAVTEDISPTIVLTLYPDLKSNTLLSKQIDTYVENQKEIKELKCKKLDYEVLKWWLHF